MKKFKLIKCTEDMRKSWSQYAQDRYFKMQIIDYERRMIAGEINLQNLGDLEELLIKVDVRASKPARLPYAV